MLLYSGIIGDFIDDGIFFRGQDTGSAGTTRLYNHHSSNILVLGTHLCHYQDHLCSHRHNHILTDPVLAQWNNRYCFYVQCLQMSMRVNDELAVEKRDINYSLCTMFSPLKISHRSPNQDRGKRCRPQQEISI